MQVFKLNKIDYRKVLRVMVAMAIAFFILNIFFTKTAHAAGTLDYGSGENPFNKISDTWGQFVNDQYRANYSLDSGDIGTFDILDKAFNSISNALFYLVITIGWLGINVFNFCFDSNISGKFSESLETVSRSLQNGTFNKFYMIFFMISLVAVVVYFLKRNYAALFIHIIGVTLIIAMSVILTTKSTRNFVVDTNNFSKEIGMTLISSLSGEDDTTEAKDSMIGTLWGNLIHKPWVIIEFDGKVSVDDKNKDAAIEKSKKILSLSPNSKDRKELVKDEINDISFTSRLASTLILSLITLIKIIIIILIGVIQMFLQVLSNLMIVFSPVILLLAIVPYFGGFNMLKWLGEKYIAIQITIVLLSFIIGALILIDKVMLEFFLGIGASFTVALLIQCVCWILVIVFRKQLVLNFTKLQRKINGTVAAGNILNKGLDKTAEYGNKALDKGKNITDKATAPARQKAVDFKDTVASNIKYAGKYASGKAKIKLAKTTGNVIDKLSDKFNKNKTKAEDINHNEDLKADNNTNNSREKVFNIKDKLNQEKTNFKEDVNTTKIRESQENKKSSIKENKETEDLKNKVKSKINNKEKMENNKTSDIGGKSDTKAKNLKKDNINRDIKNDTKEKVISFNEARVNKGKEKVNDEELKNNLRKDLQKEYRKGLREKQKVKESTRSEKLKKSLGVTKKQIRAKEKSLAKDLKNIKKANKR